MRIPIIALLTSLAVIGGSRDSRAEVETAVCMTAPVEGQKLQRATKLLDARARFLVCAAPSCPSDIMTRCEQWARAVNDALPSLVLAARDGAGRDLTDVRVSIDDGLPSSPPAHAIELDPGEHRVVFERGNAKVTRQVLLREGEKNRQVLVVFPSPDAAATDKASASPTASRPVPTSAWVVGGIGLVGLASFAIFAVKGASDRVADHCDTGCPTPIKSSVDAELRVADISLGIGILALGVASFIILTRPTAQAHSSSANAPSLVRGGAFAPFRW